MDTEEIEQQIRWRKELIAEKEQEVADFEKRLVERGPTSVDYWLDWAKYGSNFNPTCVFILSVDAFDAAVEALEIIKSGKVSCTDGGYWPVRVDSLKILIGDTVAEYRPCSEEPATHPSLPYAYTVVEGCGGDLKDAMASFKHKDEAFWFADSKSYTCSVIYTYGQSRVARDRGAL
mgnify:CR=1 FL=1